MKTNNLALGWIRLDGVTLAIRIISTGASDPRNNMTVRLLGLGLTSSSKLPESFFCANVTLLESI